jgi:hypothetical protein
MGYARWRHAVLGLLWLGLVYISAVVVRLQAGGRPAATPFSCFAKKRKQKKATQSRCPAGTRLCKSKNGKRSKLACGSDSFISNPFSAMHKRQRHMRTAKVNTSVVRFRFSAQATHKRIELRQSGAAFDLAFESKPNQKAQHQLKISDATPIILVYYFGNR